MRAGVDVVITGRGVESLTAAINELETNDAGRSVAMAVDVRDYDAVSKAVADTVAKFGGIDIVSTTPAWVRLSPSPTRAPAQWSTPSAPISPASSTSRRRRLLNSKRRGGGYIINISSNLAGKNAFVGAATLLRVEGRAQWFASAEPGSAARQHQR